MKTIYFMRHAKSSWDHLNLADHQRPLNKRGERDAPFMGMVLEHLGVRPDQILSSPAVRAHTTAQHIQESLPGETVPIQVIQRLYPGSLMDYIHALRNLPDAATSALLVAHNPSITHAVNTLAQEDIYNIPTAAIAAIRFPGDSWSQDFSNGNLEFFEYPKKYYRYGEGPLPELLR